MSDLMANIDQLKCGECEGVQFKLHYEILRGEVRYGGGGVHRGPIIVTCVNCDSESKITMQPSSLDDSDGPLCGGWG